MTQLRLTTHQIVMNRENKKALSCFDDKRYLLEVGLRSLAYGHYFLQNYPALC